MRLTIEVFNKAPHYMNTCNEYEIYLRGHKIPAIENFSILQDAYTCIDLSENEIRKLDNFPKMKKCTTFLFNNNLISKIGVIGDQLANLNSLSLTNNKISEFSEIDNLASCKKLEFLSLVDNPVVYKLHYRIYTIYKIPTLKHLDFQAVKEVEREAAKIYFEGKEGKAYIASGGVSTKPTKGSSSVVPHTQLQKDHIHELISKAQTLSEIEAIEDSLRDGTFQFPDHLKIKEDQAQDGVSACADAAGAVGGDMEVDQ